MASSEWQSIETAPKDGTEILVWDGSRVDLVRWEAFTWPSAIRPGNWFCVARGEMSWTGDAGDGQPFTVDIPLKWRSVGSPL